MPLVSVIVRTFDRPWFLARALESIAAQDEKSVEVVVVNDGNHAIDIDRFAKPLQQANLILKTVSHARPVGRGGAMNSGIRAATGDWLTALDDDDTWANGFLKAVLERARHDRRSGLEASAYVTLTESVVERPEGVGWVAQARSPFNPHLHHVRLHDLVLANRFTNNALVVPRAMVDAIGPYREDLPVLEDWEFNVRLAARFPIRVVPKLLARYHRRVAADGNAQNTDLREHRATAIAIREEWLRSDLQNGKFGVGVLAHIADLESNRGLRLFNRIASWFGR